MSLIAKLLKLFYKYVFKETLYLLHDVGSILMVLRYHLTTQFFRCDIHKDEKKKTLLFLGNGPSLSTVFAEITSRDNVNICCVNFSLLTDLYYELKPEMHVLTDGAFFDLSFPRVPDVYDALLHRIDWDIELYVPYNVTPKLLQKFSVNPYIHIVRYGLASGNFKCCYLQAFKYWLYRNNFLIPLAQNVSIAAIYLAINKGYKDIQLYGVEHSWTKFITVNNDNIVCLEDRHYYGFKQTPWMKNKTESYKMNEILLTLSRTFNSHVELAKYAKYLGNITIINKTKDSLIDAYERNNL